VNLYDGEVAYTDAQIGRVLGFLAERDLVEKSIVILTADHGEWLGELDRWDHCHTLRDIEMRVPFMISVNGEPLEDAGAALPASTLDILPTLLGLLDITYQPSDHHGEDLRRAAPDRTVAAMWSGSQVIRNAEWKLFFEGAEPTYLYQVGRDSDERWNRIGDEPEIAKLLEARMAPLRSISAKVRQQDEETIEQLENLGYIEP
jgi:arylsulfatase A-like enzyme